MRTESIDKESINENLQDKHKVDGVVWKVKKGEKFAERAFNELIKNNIIKERNYEGESIVLRTEDGEDLGICRYAIFDRVLYLSWIWVVEPIRNCGVATSMLSRCIERSKNRGIVKIYTLPKSPESKSLFEHFNFTSASEIGTPWKSKKL